MLFIALLFAIVGGFRIESRRAATATWNEVQPRPPCSIVSMPSHGGTIRQSPRRKDSTTSREGACRLRTRTNSGRLSRRLKPRHRASTGPAFSSSRRVPFHHDGRFHRVATLSATPCGSHRTGCRHVSPTSTLTCRRRRHYKRPPCAHRVGQTASTPKQPVIVAGADPAWVVRHVGARLAGAGAHTEYATSNAASRDASAARMWTYSDRSQVVIARVVSHGSRHRRFCSGQTPLIMPGK